MAEKLPPTDRHIAGRRIPEALAWVMNSPTLGGTTQRLWEIRGGKPITIAPEYVTGQLPTQPHILGSQRTIKR